MISSMYESRQVHRYNERTQKKKIRIQEKMEIQIVNQINNILKFVVTKEYIDSLAIKMGIQKRKRKLTPLSIVSVLMIGCSNGSEEVPIATLEIMCSFLRKWFNIHVKPQSLQAKINDKQIALFVKEIMSKIMKSEIEKTLKKIIYKKNKKSIFLRILLQDSTVISLPESIARIFQGCGGAASKAAVKCDYIIDQNSHLIIRMKCVSGKIPDAALSNDIVSYTQKGDLIVRDLGYFNLAHFAKIAKKDAYFLSRLSKSANFYLHEHDEQPTNIIEHFNKLHIKNKAVDVDGYLGKKERLPVRLVGIMVPAEVVAARRQQYKEARGGEPSESLSEWNGYTIMVTNIPREMQSIKALFKLYKIRWQIELFFKNIKSILIVDKFTGMDKYRILSLLYSKLAIAWIGAILYAYAQTRIAGKKEVSLFKFTRWLMAMGYCQGLFSEESFSKIIYAIDRDIDLLCKRKRTKKATWEDIIFDEEKVA